MTLPTDIAYKILAYIGIGAIMFGGGYYYGHSNASASMRAKYAVELAASTDKAKATEDKWQSDFNINARNLTNVLNTTIANRDRIIKRLHDDKKRASVPEGSGTNCPSPSWRTIPSEMGEEIIREVAERDQYREGLMSCYSAMDSIR